MRRLKDLMLNIDHHAFVLLNRFGPNMDRWLYQTGAIFYFEGLAFSVDSDREYQIPGSGVVLTTYLTVDLILDGHILMLIRAEPSQSDLGMVLMSFMLHLSSIRYGIALNFNYRQISQALGNIIVLTKSDLPLVGKEEKTWDGRSSTDIF